jgi:hypothetical protein
MKKRPYYFYISTLTILLLLSITLGLSAQSPILWDNPSLEDEPAHSHPPLGWFYCDDAGESPPDIHPGGFFGVTKAPHDGLTYLGLVVRDNGTNEGIGQRLSNLLSPGQCYELHFFAARSDQHQSMSRSTGQFVKFDQAAQVRIWGGMHNCDKSGLLAQSGPISNTDWEGYTLRFNAPQVYTHFVIEAAHLESRSAYNGNVLLDQLSPLVPVDCESRQPLCKIERPQLPEVANKDALSEQIAHRLQQVQITADGRLKEQLIALPSGSYMQANLPLWECGWMLRQFPAYKLEIGLAKKYPATIKQELQRQIWYSLQASGADEKQINVKGRVNSNRWEATPKLRYRLKH